MSVPKYQRIASNLRARIGRGEYPPGSTLPTQQELAEAYSAAQNTVKSALAVLRGEGLIETAQGVAGAEVLRTPGPAPLTITQRLERLERHVFGEDGT
ncbi:MAG: GntR family transcriptional regulator [Streptosporangiaceae bacterium]